MMHHPLNAAFRFVLEIAMIVGYWVSIESLWLKLPVVASVLILWGVFRVPNDPGPAPITVRGYVRLVLEAAAFGGAVALLVLSGRFVFAGVFALLLLIHYAFDHRRVRWLVAREARGT